MLAYLIPRRLITTLVMMFFQVVFGAPNLGVAPALVVDLLEECAVLLQWVAG